MLSISTKSSRTIAWRGIYVHRGDKMSTLFYIHFLTLQHRYTHNSQCGTSIIVCKTVAIDLKTITVPVVHPPGPNSHIQCYAIWFDPKCTKLRFPVERWTDRHRHFSECENKTNKTLKIYLPSSMMYTENPQNVSVWWKQMIRMNRNLQGRIVVQNITFVFFSKCWFW